MTDAPSFPRMYARTLRFTLGTPRNLQVTPDGSRVLFVRTPSGTSRTGALWSYDVADGQERLIADPAQLLGDSGEELSAEERARRERSRETAGGIVGYTTDATASVAAFALSGAIWVAEVAGEGARRLPSNGPVIDPHIDPTGRTVAYANDGALRVIDVDGASDRALVEPDGDEVVWGQAEFVAAEEMERYRGFWWAPDGESLLVERYDNTPVPVWYVADPANPESEPVRHRYPAAGSTNADVSLWHITLDGTRRRLDWDDDAYPYLTRVGWSAFGGPLLQVMSRDQRAVQIRRFDVESGSTSLVRELHDDTWLDLFVGVPAYAPDGRLVTVEPSEDTNRVALDGEPISPVGLQVRRVLAIDDRGVLVTANDDPTELHLVRIGLDGSVNRLTAGGGVHNGSAAGATMVVVRSALDVGASSITVYREGAEIGQISNLAEDPGFRPNVSSVTVGDRDLHAAVLFPRDHVRGARRLPVLMDPYGGPHALRNVKSSRGFLLPQWLADQGFCVIVSDGRGTPGRGPAWDRSVRDNFVATLDDQVDALQGVAHAYPDDVDTGHVAITGWSFGGYLAGMAVLRRPDIFHTAVAGAPVTDQRLYDTFYTERYLGHPDEQPEVYDRNSLGELAGALERPLMIIHGMVDDNVVVAHSLRLSSALLAAGRPHEVLPLTGVTHMTPQETVAENLQLLQVEFIKRGLGIG
ncbi:S9 family peptidase [Solicola gregarius]|uniref:Prolyl oligopeptidase family serine peptidase n=1 Tax=Solicola gregarius TaxID=2908642 RepID=A0AA46YMZ0_9ACTN|nr:prolyl oligopeptidase family serine peptidase [Solicola gregarius]UYM06208.1 prolyl oligopeptidase family serine peptidase [Solicola gregarius]